MKPTDEEIEKAALEYARSNSSDHCQPFDFVNGAKWARDQQPKEDIDTLKSKAYALDTLWDPIVDYAQSHKIGGLRPGDSISDFVLKLLKERTL